MSKLSEFIGAPKEIEIRGKKIKIYPLKVKDLVLFPKEATPEETLKLSREIIRKSLNDPELTDEEIDSLDIEVFAKLMNEINKLNGFEDERIGKIKEKIVQTRAKRTG